MKKIILSIVLVVNSVALAELKVPPLFADHMVLQRDIEIPVWGTASPGEEVAVEVAGKSSSTTADDKGNWKVKLPALKLADATAMIVATKSKRLVFNDVLIGDVWVCSGQSNMQMSLDGVNKGSEEIAHASHPNIRLFNFNNTVSVEPSREVKGEWKTCTPQSAESFSAVAYFFGREIHEREHVPIGLIANSWGGMPAEAFTSKEALEADPDFKGLLDAKAKAAEVLPAELEKYKKARADWEAKFLHTDPGNKGFDKGFASENPPGEWKPMNVPGKWEKNASLKIDGAVWFRKEIEIPQEWAGKELLVQLGHIDDFDQAYFNGKKIGEVASGNPWAVFVQRKYPVPAELVKAGKATLAVRVYDQWGEGGFGAPAERMNISLKDDKAAAKPISLAGEWKYSIEYSVDTPENAPPPPNEPQGNRAPHIASNLFNGMVWPVIPYAIKGVIWYQGESNAPRAQQYRKLFPAMIEDWRKNWGQGDFPFLFVQLANFNIWKPQAAETWAELREAQTMSLKLPKTGMAVTIDIGDAGDIHPKNKQDVGKRLALAAEKIAYGKALEFSGPMYDSMSVDGENVRLKFTHADGLKWKGEKLVGFQIAGEDQKFVTASATIDGGVVVVSSKDVSKPVAVRYAWTDNPTCNLYNSADLPASPFRTDDWKMVTDGAK